MSEHIWWTKYTKERNGYTGSFDRDDDFDDDSGRGYVNIEDSELQKICDDVTQMVRLVTYRVRMENEDLQIKRGNKQKQQNSGGNVASGLEYLAIRHLNDDKSSAASKFIIRWAGTPESAGVNNKFDSVVAVKVERVSSGQRYWWMLSDENPNLDVLEEKLGLDTDHWINRELEIFIFTEQPSEKKFVRSEVLPVTKEAKAAKSNG
jgi:hypothetical protein